MAVSRLQGASIERCVAWIEALAAAGVGALQIREKECSDREIYELALLARSHFPSPGLLLINGRPDIALAAGADGVHLPARGLPVAAVLRSFGAELLIGRSTHTLSEVEAARREGADWVLFGPVWPTPGKKPAGCEPLREAASLGVPVYAVGGVTHERLREAAKCGAVGAAAVRLFQEPKAAAGAALEAARHFERPTR
jgi:thiamine-phosphate pyrophosphorylase